MVPVLLDQITVDFEFKTQPLDVWVKYMKNSIMYLEDQIYEATKDESTSYDTILPYMMSVKPSLQFVDSSNVLAPEFYLTHPIYIDHEKYEDQGLDNEYYHIFKFYHENDATIQLIPEEYVENRPLMSDIVKFNATLMDSEGARFSIGNYENSENYNAFTLNISSGTITLSENVITTFETLLAEYRKDNEMIADYDVYIVLNFHIEKYRDITVARDDITPQEAQRIATMQSVHQSILQYTYEFIHAENAQQGLSEICYTVFVTITSTLIVMGLNYGLEFSLSKIGALTSLAPLYSRGGSYNLFKVATALASEPLEEVYVDPVLEAYVKYAVADIGGDATAQILLSGLAESGRESLSGGISILANIGTKTDVQIDMKIDQNRGIDMKEQIAIAQEAKIKEENKQDYITESLSTIFMFSGALMGGVFGSVGMGFGSMLIGLGCSVEAIASLRDVYKSVLASHQLELYNSKISFGDVFNSEVSDPVLNAMYNEIDESVEAAIRFASLREKPLPTQKHVEKVTTITRADTSKLSDWISRHKKGIAIAGYAVAGIVGAIVPAVGAVLSTIPTLTVAMVDKNIQRKNTKFLTDMDGNVIPYIDIGVAVNDLTPIQFKNTYKGPYSQHFKFIKEHHNLYLGVKTVGKLLEIFSHMNIYGVIYKISLVRDKDGYKIRDGPEVIYSENLKTKEGLIRIGRATDLVGRIRTYIRQSFVEDVNRHFENAFREYGPRAFKIELLSVCRSEKEYIASEYFWILFYNKKANEEGYSLDINQNFNPTVRARGDKLQKYNIPKPLLVIDIINGLERAELDLVWKDVPLGTLKNRLKDYFGMSDLYKIRLKLAAPYIDKCLRRGYTEEETINYLVKYGFNMFSDEYYQKRINTFGDEYGGKIIRRVNPKRLLKRMQNDLYAISPRSESRLAMSVFEQLRLELFIIPFSNYLREIDVKERIKATPTSYDFTTKRYASLDFDEASSPIDEFSIIEHLVKRHCSNLQIAYALGLWTYEDDPKMRVSASSIIDTYFVRYQRRLGILKGVEYYKISPDEVRAYIINHNLGLLEYKDYLGLVK